MTAVRPLWASTSTGMLAALLISAGCGPSGPETYDFRGKLTWNGEPPPIRRIAEQKIGGIKVFMVKVADSGSTRDVKQATVADDGTFVFETGNRPGAGKWRFCVIWQDDYPTGPDKLKKKLDEKNSKIYCTIPEQTELNLELNHN